jgi:hypothetical protein
MNPRVKTVQCLEEFGLFLVFNNGEQRRFDCRPYLQTGVFQELQDLRYFHQARVEMGTVVWPNEQDFCPDTLYQDSVPIKIEPPTEAENP